MCGRYGRVGSKQKVAEAFHARLEPEELAMPDADYNIAPTTYQPIIRRSREDGYREMVLARWGLIPYFTKSLNDVKGISTINARSETISTSPTWRTPFKKRRCIVPASHFYEWPKGVSVKGQPKQLYTFDLSSGAMMGLAGLWDAWKDEQGHWLQSYSIVTTDANELMAAIHDRMPVILHQQDFDRWLDRDENLLPPTDLLRPYESEGMEMKRANLLVNNVRNNGAELLIAPTGDPTDNSF